MADNLSLVRRAVNEHENIRGQIRSVGESMSDQEALTALEKAHTDWTPGRFEAIYEKRKRLQQVLGVLEHGLEKHFEFEEKAFPPLLGDLLMRALELQHGDIREEIKEARMMVASAEMEGLGREQLLLQESRIQQRIGVIIRLVEEHASREELILEMIRKALEDKG